jgi:predicted Rossmann-fold nucleotide-binding protein
VGVLGSGDASDSRAEEVGRLVAALGCDLLTGGGGGVMEAASRAFANTPGRAGVVIGIVPGTVDGMDALERRSVSPGSVRYSHDARYPNSWVEIAIFTHLPDSGEQGTLRSSRNHINVLSSDALVALPGRAGTWSEMWLALQYGVPLIAYGPHASVPDGVRTAQTLEEVKRFLGETLRP